ncbi:aminodeoxychorismate lyase [Georgenia sp. M64]|uniref:aminodeoxychorismate lyase n=1 Tax=Georgenia sp. M64 TaxID=3120520 RepID=UPI0030E1B47C
MSTPAVLVLVDEPRRGRPGRPLRRVAADEPHVLVTDLGITRGDGVFETVGIAAGRPQALDAHLARLARSAALLELPPPDLGVFRAATLEVAGALADAPSAWCKLVLTRGPEGEDRATGWAYGEVSRDWSRERTDGIAVVTLTRGYASDVTTSAPWLLQGAKSLSYALNRAALREAQRRGADDVIFTSTDGYVLEGPTSTVVLRLGGVLVTPPVEAGVLPGTTQADAFELLAARGAATRTRPVRVAELADADALWLMSSTRLAAPVRELDGRPVAVDAHLTAEINDALAARTS